MKPKLKPFCLLLLTIALALSCQTKQPERILDATSMENVLYDLHLAQSMARNSGDSIDYRVHLYSEAALQKHHLTREEFEQSLAWYTRHADKLFEIYKNVDKRFAEETSWATWTAEAPVYATTGDTANIWMERDNYLLSSTHNNRMTFHLPVDTMVNANDKLEWRFTTQWIYPEGQKSATAILAVRFDNDSTQFISEHILTTGKQKITLRIANKKVKQVEGMIYLQSPWTERPRLLHISNPVLLRYKSKQGDKPRKALKMSDI